MPRLAVISVLERCPVRLAGWPTWTRQESDPDKPCGLVGPGGERSHSGRSDWRGQGMRPNESAECNVQKLELKKSWTPRICSRFAPVGRIRRFASHWVPVKAEWRDTLQ